MSKVLKCQMWANQDDDGNNMYTNAFIDFTNVLINHFCVPVNEKGEEESELVKINLLNCKTNLKHEYILKLNKEIEEILNNYIKGDKY